MSSSIVEFLPKSYATNGNIAKLDAEVLNLRRGSMTKAEIVQELWTRTLRCKSVYDKKSSWLCLWKVLATSFGRHFTAGEWSTNTPFWNARHGRQEISWSRTEDISRRKRLTLINQDIKVCAAISRRQKEVINNDRGLLPRKAYCKSSSSSEAHFSKRAKMSTSIIIAALNLSTFTLMRRPQRTHLHSAQYTWTKITRHRTTAKWRARKILSGLGTKTLGSGAQGIRGATPPKR